MDKEFLYYADYLAVEKLEIEIVKMEYPNQKVVVAISNDEPHEYDEQLKKELETIVEKDYLAYVNYFNSTGERAWLTLH